MLFKFKQMYFRANRIEDIFKEKINESKCQVDFFKKEINCLNYIINQDENKLLEISEYILLHFSYNY